MKRFFILILFLASCRTIRERRPGGDSFAECTLLFRHTLNAADKDMLVGNVRSVRLYAFDAASEKLLWSTLLSEEQIGDGRQTLTFQRGAYTLVAWGTSASDLASAGYRDVETVDAASHLYVAPGYGGTTTLGNFRVMLDAQALDDGSFGDLYYARADDVQVVPGKETTVDFDFVRNTNALKVGVSGLENLDASRVASRASESPVEVFVSARNGVYGSDNSMGEFARELHYPAPLTVGHDRVSAAIRTLRMDMTRAASYPVWLYVRSVATGADLIEPIDIIATLLTARDASGALLYTRQEDFDRIYEHPIELRISRSLQITLVVGDWQEIELQPIVKNPNQ